MLDKLLLQARSMGASDLHLTPASVPMARIDGSLQPLQNEFISREKLEAALLALLPEQEKRQLLQTGEIDTAFSDRLQERCRLNIYRLSNGYAAAIRLLPKDIPDCNSLGLPQIISQLAESSSGLLLVTRCHRKRQKHNACLAGTADKSNTRCTYPDVGGPDRICLS